MNPKSWFRAPARPVIRFVDRRIAFRQIPIFEQLEGLRAQTAELRRDIDRSVSAVLSALSSHNAEARIGARSLGEERRRIVAELAERLETIERQIDLLSEVVSPRDESPSVRPGPRLIGDASGD